MFYYYYYYRARVVVQDNTATMVVLIAVNVTDGDEPDTPNSQVTLTLDDDFGGLFAIMDHNIISNQPLAGQVGSYNVLINAQDNGVPQQSTSAMFTIEVVNTNNHAPVFVGLDDLSIIENQIVRQTFTIMDDDITTPEGTAMTPIITGQFVNNFTIDIISTNQYELVPTTPLDYEEEDVLTLTLTVSDSGAEMFRQTTSINITVTVIDVNDNSPVIENLTPGMSISVSEETEMGYVVYQVSATDRDDGMNAELSFSVDSAPIIPFTIDLLSGNITTTRVINDAVGTSFSVNVTVTDGGTPALTDSSVVIFTITDINNRPEFMNLPAMININEDFPVDDLVVDFMVEDNDEGDAGTYSIELQQTGCFFRLDGESIRLNQTLDYEVSVNIICDRFCENGSYS